MYRAAPLLGGQSVAHGIQAGGTRGATLRCGLWCCGPSLVLGEYTVRIGEHTTLRRPEEFHRCYKRGRMAKNGLAVVHVLPNDEGRTRIGISVSTKLGKAVVRNRMKRRLREAVRRIPLKLGYDLVISARGRAKRAPFAELERALRELCQATGILRNGATLDAVPRRAIRE